MYEEKMRNFWLTITGMVLAFASWVLAGVFSWPNVEWVVMTILGVAGISAGRALGDYRRKDISPTPPIVDLSNTVREAFPPTPPPTPSPTDEDQLTVPN